MPLPRTDAHVDSKALLERLRMAKEQSNAERLLSTILKNRNQLLRDPKELQQLVESAKKDGLQFTPNNPVLKSLQHNPMFKQLQDSILRQKDPQALVSQLPPDLQRLVAEGNKDLTPSGGNATPQVGAGTSPTSPGAGPTPEAASVPNGGLSAPSPEEEDSSPFEKWLLKQAESMADNDSFRNSAAIQDAVEAFRRYTARSMAESSGSRSAWSKRMGKLVPQVFSGEWLGRVNWPDISRLPLPSLRNFRLPRLLPQPQGAAPRAGSRLSAPSGSMLNALLWVGALGGIAFLLWRLNARLNSPGGPQGRRAGGGLHGNEVELGPWPIAPEAISSRADLIRAFEYLSLLKLGSRVRTWNHREIAAEFGHADPGQHEIATHLAGLYERARYAPTSETMPSDAVHAARQEIAFLARESAI